MKRLILSFLFILFPTLALASSFNNPTGITFTPTPGDFSVVFLGDLFGVVDGVLHGTGSQILGSIFSVFNSAVLALGGVVTMYTLLVSTVNTANEGKMLGQKWSSVWVPVRTTLGLALLIPKASGYCLMQIFVMWVVVQGIGAADKVWTAALSYIARGGVIAQPQSTPIPPPTIIPNPALMDVPLGASKILTGQVCMYGLQVTLENLRTAYLNEKQNDSGPCFLLQNSNDSPMNQFCNTPVPDFLSTVNPVAMQNSLPNKGAWNLPMPNFPMGSIYSSLNGVCGTIMWNAFDTTSLYTVNPKNGQTMAQQLNASEIQTITMSRAVALQQLYNDLALIAQVMVNNDPLINKPPTTSTGTPPTYTPPWAMQQFGIPLSASSNSLCSDSSVTSNCTSWGPIPGNSTTPLFNGAEFQNAIGDYMGVMAPSLNIMNQAIQTNLEGKLGQFINQANAQGWMQAGSYFINLAQLNSANLNSSLTTTYDTGAGLNDTTNVDVGSFQKIAPWAFTGTNNYDCQKSTNPNLCTWLNANGGPLVNIVSLINGQYGSDNSGIALPTLAQPISPYTGNNASTVYGYINNSSMLNLGQPGMTPPQFTMNIIPKFNPTNISLPHIDFPCGHIKVVGCVGAALGDVFYNGLIRNLFNFFFSLLVNLFNAVIMAFLYLPLKGMTVIFQNSIAWLQQPSMNPVIALSNMGISFINFANELWIYLLIFAISPFGIFIMPFIALVMPLLVAWLGTMLVIGFITAYYIPFLPYMIFTFGSIGWLMAVVEAMVAAPIVALGVTHPEGEGPFGKGEQAIMILMNVFLRPSMMIIGYIAAIALSYVSVWVINAGFSNVLSYLQNNQTTFSFSNDIDPNNIIKPDSNLGYSGWAGVYAYFFSIIIYTTMYLTVVQKAFTLIVVLPDKVLRWIGGQAESAGQETVQWTEDTKGKVGEATKATTGAAQQIDKQLSGYAMKGVSKLQKMGSSGGGASASSGLQSGPPTTPDKDS
ncbi:defect in organelle trafficking protein DotA [Legionella busanensis]|uniref:Defect in organelle trafficking protein DotA n=1 Tax=Legionella busanensis TaxID=190655 RepID=A0A378JWD7_9GAMM|nr:type IVB secretion system protein DotA [Legionella busanensis]STX52532.1 defect in organelle trafficking protein DotA [Legionella busanensis]